MPGCLLPCLSCCVLPRPSDLPLTLTVPSSTYIRAVRRIRPRHVRRPPLVNMSTRYVARPHLSTSPTIRTFSTTNSAPLVQPALSSRQPPGTHECMYSSAWLASPAPMAKAGAAFGTDSASKLQAGLRSRKFPFLRYGGKLSPASQTPTIRRFPLLSRLSTP